MLSPSGLMPLWRLQPADDSGRVTTGLRVKSLSRDDCIGLLAPGGLGRVAVSSGALPAVYSVFFSLVGGYIVLRLAATWVLCKEADQAVVAFNADYTDKEGRSGWSVMVQGLGEQVTDLELEASLRSIPLRAWGEPSEDDVFVRIALNKVSGTRYSL